MAPVSTLLQYPPWLYAALWKEIGGCIKEASLKHKNAVWGIARLKEKKRIKVSGYRKSNLFLFNTLINNVKTWGLILTEGVSALPSWILYIQET